MVRRCYIALCSCLAQPQCAVYEAPWKFPEEGRKCRSLKYGVNSHQLHYPSLLLSSCTSSLILDLCYFIMQSKGIFGSEHPRASLDHSLVLSPTDTSQSFLEFGWYDIEENIAPCSPAGNTIFANLTCIEGPYNCDQLAVIAEYSSSDVTSSPGDQQDRSSELTSPEEPATPHEAHATSLLL